MIKYWGIQEGRGEDEEEGKEEADTILFHYYNNQQTLREGIHLYHGKIQVQAKQKYSSQRNRRYKHGSIRTAILLITEVNCYLHSLCRRVGEEQNGGEPNRGDPNVISDAGGIILHTNQTNNAARAFQHSTHYCLPSKYYKLHVLSDHISCYNKGSLSKHNKYKQSRVLHFLLQHRLFACKPTTQTESQLNEANAEIFKWQYSTASY